MTVSVKAFNELFQETQDNILKLNKQKAVLEKQTYELKSEISILATHRKRLQRLAKTFVRNNTGEKNYWKWSEQPKEGPSAYAKLAWREWFDFKMSDYHFYIIFKERTDLKKQKWEVQVHGDSELPYRDNTYGADKYKAAHQKFTSEEAARVHIKEMMDRIVRDHQEDLDWELSLVATLDLEKAKALVDKRFYD